MNLEYCTTEELLEELTRRNIVSDEIRFKSASVDGAKWSDLTLVYTTEDLFDEKILKVAPFFKDEFCYNNLGEEVKEILPNALGEVEECVFEFFGDTAEKGIEFLQNLGFKMRRDDDFFGY